MTMPDHEPRSSAVGPSHLMSRDEVISSINELIRRLHALGEPADIRIIGGAAIALWHDNERRQTVDVDADLFPLERIVELADAIGEEHTLPEEWLNNNARIFLPSGMGRRGEEWVTVYDQDGVVIRTASLDMLIAMKLNAAQRRGLRELPDLQVLLAEANITTVAEAEDLFESFYPADFLSDKAIRITESALSEPIRAAADPPRLGLRD